MSTFKKCKVLLLPTNKKAEIGTNVIVKHNTTLAYGKKVQESYNLAETEQHLYILSDEEIKEEDWFVGFADGSIKPFVMQADESTVEINNWQLNIKGYSSNKKIIATTDRSIKIVYDGKTPISENWNGYLLPQPSQSFIEKFVEEYNKGNVITEVMVEYEEKLTQNTVNSMMFVGMNIKDAKTELNLKINPDNTINIINSKV